MLNPKLVSWDKMSWKTLQQLANWNKEWKEMLEVLYGVRKLRLEVRCSWFNEGFLESILGALEGLGALSETVLVVECKDLRVEKVLKEGQGKGRLGNFSCVVQEWKNSQK